MIGTVEIVHTPLISIRYLSAVQFLQIPMNKEESHEQKIVGLANDPEILHS
jgi:hypothetical protein